MELIELSIVKDEEYYEPEDDFEANPQHLYMEHLDKFFKHNGMDIYEETKNRFKGNHDIYNQLSIFEQKYFLIDTDSIVTYEQ
jgi:hypothetical protein